VVDEVAPGLLLRIMWLSAVSTIPQYSTNTHTHTFHSPTADAVSRIILATESVVEHMNII
jgi:hypothetical protein